MGQNQPLEFLPEAERHLLLPVGEVAQRIGKLFDVDPLDPPVADCFPKTLQPVALTLRQLDEPGYVALVQYASGRWTLGRACNHVDPHGEKSRRLFSECMHAIAALQGGKPSKEDVLRLTRTECPHYGINVRNPEGESDVPSHYDATKPLIVTLEGQETVGQPPDEQKIATFFHVRVRPGGNISTVSCDGCNDCALKNGETITLGRGALSIKSVFGEELLQERRLGVDMAVGDGGVSRACLKIRRSKDGQHIDVLNCGAIRSIGVAQEDKMTMHDHGESVHGLELPPEIRRLLEDDKGEGN